jgi:predicted TIM-barrel enzyme
MRPKDIFRKQTSLLAVIHAESADQVIRNTDVALAGGADGVFLINHAISDAALVYCYHAARSRFESAWIGLSFMRLGATESVRLAPATASGLWVSDAGIEEQGPQPEDVHSLSRLRAESGRDGLYFGGVAFKHQRPVKDPAAAARAAVPFVDVITTSGSATGSAPSTEKVASMRGAIGGHPLAIASGVSPENVQEYLHLVDCILASSSISDSEAELSPKRLARLVRAIEG